MLSDERIQQSKQNFKRYLNDGLIKKTTDKISLNILLKNSKDSLKASQLLFEHNYYLWTIITSYYSMFYIANAVLIKYGYKVGNQIVHKVTVDSLIFLIRPKLNNKLLEYFEELKEEALNIAKIKSDEIIQSFDFERNKRNYIQYETTNQDILSKAKTSLERSKLFLFELESLII